MAFNEKDFIRLCKKYNNVYIYGAGKNANRLYYILQELEIGVSGFYVSKMEGNPKFLLGLPVMPIEAFKDCDNSLIIVSVSAENKNNYTQILKKLKSLNITDTLSLSASFYTYYENKRLNLVWQSDYSQCDVGEIKCTSPKVSLLLPSLNSAKYISETLDSVCNQSLNDIEILCIDSGSTDGTREIIRRYGSKDKRIRLEELPVKSYGAQLNYGIRKAQGEFIGIIETDDFIAPDMCHDLYNHAIKHDADFVKADFELFTDRFPEGRIFLKSVLGRPTVDDSRCYTRDDYLNFTIPRDTFIWNGIYRRSWLLKNQIVFQETPGASYQDYGVRHQLGFAADRGFILNKSFYRYRRDNAASSMWSGKSAIFNYNESAFLVRMAKERNWPRNYLSHLTLFFVINGLYPILDTLLFSEPDKSTKEGIENFRILYRELIDEGYLSPENTGVEEYCLAKMLIERPAELFKYMLYREEIAMEPLMRLLDTLSGKEEIVIYGDDQNFMKLHATLRANDINPVLAITNNSSPFEQDNYLGIPVAFPEEITSRRPNAHYVVTGEKIFTELSRKRLIALGVSQDNITEFNMWLDPFRCFQPSLRSPEDYRQVLKKALDLNLF